MPRRKITDEEEALATVKENGFAIDYVPDELREEVRGRLENGKRPAAPVRKEERNLIGENHERKIK